MRTNRIAVGAALIATLGLAACSGQTEEPTTPPTGNDVSGQVTLYTSEVQDNIDQLIAAFNKQYPNIKVDVFRAGTGDLNARLESEIASTGQPQADVFLAADVPTFEGLKSRDLLMQYTPTGVENLIPDVVDKDNYYTGTRITSSVIAYNTGLVSTPPTSWQALTDAQYKDQLVMPNPQVSGAAATNSAIWLEHPQLGESWLRALAANTPTILDANGPVSQAIAAGSSPIGVVVDYMMLKLASDGSPVAIVFPEEGVPYVSQPVGIFKTAQDPEAAKLLVDFIVSKEGQEVAVTQFQIPVHTGVATPEGVPALSEINLINPDYDRISEIKTDAVNLFVELMF